MTIVRFHEWSNRPRGATTSSHPIGTTRGITFHWEGPRMGSFGHDRCPEKVRGIQAFHRDSRGWSEVAYNAIVCPHGTVYEGRGPGVKSAANGFSSVNDDWYAVCYLGGEGDGLTEAGKQGFRDAVQWLRDEGNAGPLINGHRDHKPTACPGDAIYAWLKSGDAEPNSEEITVRPVDFLRYRLFGKNQGNRSVADVLREDNANLRKIAADVAAIKARLEAQESSPKA